MVYVQLYVDVYACVRARVRICMCAFFFLRVNSDQPSQLMHTYDTHYRVAKTHRMPSLYRSSSAKEPYN